MAMSFFLKPAPDDPEPVESTIDLEEIITDFDLDNGTFTFVGKTDILERIPMQTSTPLEWLSELFLAYGGYYGVRWSEASQRPISEAVEHMKKSSGPTALNGLITDTNEVATQFMMKLIHTVAPVLTTSCSLEYLKKRSGTETGSIRTLMGL
jgi:hypothetical protein